MRKEFLKELEESGWIHRPLPLHMENSIESERKEAKIFKKKVLWQGTKDGVFVCRDQGSCFPIKEEDCECLRMTGRLKLDYWPGSMPQDGDCSYYGNLSAVLKLEPQDWSEYNRLRFRVRPDCKGLHTVSLSVWIKNEGEEKVPDVYNRTGQHMIYPQNHQWNDCIWELSSVSRDCITQLEFRYRLSGSDTGAGKEAVFDLAEICLEKTEEEKYWGWDTQPGHIACDTCGYFPKERKTALMAPGEGKFCLTEKRSGRVVLEKEMETVKWAGKEFGVADFSEIEKEGEYLISCSSPDIKPQSFCIGEDWVKEIIWKGLNFIFCQRCGYPVPGKHGCCHTDCLGIHNHEKVPYWGGWHDAGDMSQQTVQTAETARELFLTAENVKEDRLLYERLIEEACWGLSFTLKTRFGDGHRATSLGLIRWTDGIQGTQDDAQNVRVHNHGIDNLICACAEVEAARVLENRDHETAWAAREAAIEDFYFGTERYGQYGLEESVIWEHTYGSGESLYFAVAGKCAGLLYRITGEEKYLEQCGLWADKLLECQERSGDIKGFFYRNASRKHIVHFNHQARERYYAECLGEAAALFAKEKNGEKYIEGLKAYGEYLERLMDHASPYGMIPAGVYREDEAEDKKTFRRIHIQADYSQCREEYRKQVKNGEKISDSLYLRQFPVWFSFRGNTNVQLSMAQAALAAGKILKKEKLLYAAREQIHWVNGKNPFAQSLMVGSGKRFGTLYAVFPGVCAGQLPVGIQTKKNEDFPYWPAGNQATYREVWTSCTVKMMGVCGEILKKTNKNIES